MSLRHCVVCKWDIEGWVADSRGSATLAWGELIA
jgi:hypothetical protein